MELETKPHEAEHEYAFECSECESILLLAFFGSVESSVVYGDCTECGAEEVEMNKHRVRDVDDEKLFSLHLRQFVSEEVEDADVSRSSVVESLRDVADDIESGEF